jgi:L-lactate dehydrogenase complex protein LldG
MSEARELVLDAVRGALAGAAPAEAVPREYLRHGTLDAQARIALLCERISDYRAQVHRVDAADLAATIGDAFARQSATRVCVPAGVPAQWRPAGLDLLTDDGLSFDALDRLDGVLTGATLAIAQTGTIVLTAAPAEGRRALTLVPDLHVCVVGEEQVVETVPEALAPLAELVRTRRSPITLISGPSATSDIELRRVEGVHGPRRLIVIVVNKETP